MNDGRSQFLCRRLCRCFFLAMPVAAMVTWGAQTYAIREGVPSPIEDGGTLYLNRVMGLPADHIDASVDALAEGRHKYPLLRSYCETVADRARRYVQDASYRYDVWTLTYTYSQEHGWPFPSWVEAGRVYVDKHGPGRTGGEYIFWADVTGSPPIRYSGLAANWLVYFAVSLAVAWPVDMAVCAMIRRRRRVRSGFPVVPP